MDIYLLALLGSALLHPFWIALPKKAAHPLTLNFLAICLTSIFFFPFLLNGELWNRVLAHAFLFSLLTFFQVSYTISVLTFTKNHSFQVAYPLTRLAPLCILFVEMYVLQGGFSLSQIIGISFVSVGAVLFGYDSEVRNMRTSFFLLLLWIMLTMTGSMICTKMLTPVFSPAEFWALAALQLPFYLPFVLKRKRELKKDFGNIPLLIGAAFAMVGTWGLALYALHEYSAATVSAVRSLSLVFGVFLGARMFDEGHKWQRYFAAALIVLGAVMSVAK